MANPGSTVSATTRRKPPNAGKGRRKGVPNRLTREIRLAIENAFVELGGEKYLVRLGKKNPAVFVPLLGKLLPMQITGAGGGALTVNIVKFAEEASGKETTHA